eukprot:TRINITY_DN20869_c0_g3_i1.p1 TRINITY_DN20869_c0_g3~~TRINITY_DN20869_c0_g3_i1.p1  ORF type:complete len:809 (-),score=122.49 TRINITY_DN20869_c0_g3_i1:38-2425(-)
MGGADWLGGDRPPAGLASRRFAGGVSSLLNETSDVKASASTLRPPLPPTAVGEIAPFLSGKSDAYGFTRKRRGEERGGKRTESSMSPGRTSGDDAYGFDRKAKAPQAGTDSWRCLLRDAGGTGNATETRESTEAVVTQEFAIAGYHRRGSPSRHRARSASLGEAPGACEGSNSGREVLGFQQRDSEYGLGRRGRRAVTPQPDVGRVIVHSTEPGPAERPSRRMAPTGPSTARQALIAAPPAFPVTRHARAEVLRREHGTVRVVGGERVASPARPAGLASPGRTAWADSLSYASDDYGSPRQDGRAPWSPGSMSNRSCERSSRTGDALGLRWEGTSDDDIDAAGSSLLSDGSPLGGSQVRRGHVRDMYQDGCLPSCIGRGKRHFAQDSGDEFEGGPATCRSPSTSRGIEWCVDAEAGQRVVPACPLFKTAGSGGALRGRRHHTLSGGEHHFVSPGVAAGDERLRGRSRDDFLEGGLPRGIGHGRRFMPQKYLSHFEEHASVAPHLTVPPALVPGSGSSDGAGSANGAGVGGAAAAATSSASRSLRRIDSAPALYTPGALQARDGTRDSPAADTGRGADGNGGTSGAVRWPFARLRLPTPDQRVASGAGGSAAAPSAAALDGEGSEQRRTRADSPRASRARFEAAVEGMAREADKAAQMQRSQRPHRRGSPQAGSPRSGSPTADSSVATLLQSPTPLSPGASPNNPAARGETAQRRHAVGWTAPSALWMRWQGSAGEATSRSSGAGSAAKAAPESPVEAAGLSHSPGSKNASASRPAHFRFEGAVLSQNSPRWFEAS